LRPSACRGVLPPQAQPFPMLRKGGVCCVRLAAICARSSIARYGFSVVVPGRLGRLRRPCRLRLSAFIRVHLRIVSPCVHLRIISLCAARSISSASARVWPEAASPRSISASSSIRPASSSGSARMTAPPPSRRFATRICRCA